MSNTHEGALFPQVETLQPTGIDENPDAELEAMRRTPPAPGEESAGPALTQLVTEMRLAAVTLQSLYGKALRDSQTRESLPVRVGGQLDANGAGAFKLFDVPQGTTGYLMRLVVEVTGRTPVSTALSASIYAWLTNQQPALPAAGADAPFGSVLAIWPNQYVRNTGVGGGAGVLCLPMDEKWDHPDSAPALRGGQSFWFVLSGSQAALQNRAISIAANLRLESVSQ